MYTNNSFIIKWFTQVELWINTIINNDISHIPCLCPLGKVYISCYLYLSRVNVDCNAIL